MIRFCIRWWCKDFALGGGVIFLALSINDESNALEIQIFFLNMFNMCLSLEMKKCA